MDAAGIILLLAVVLIVLALVYYLGLRIFELPRFTEGLDTAIDGVVEIIAKSEPVNPIVSDSNLNLDAAVDALEGLLFKKAGLPEAMGLIEGLYPGAKQDGLCFIPAATTEKSPRIGEVYTRGTL